MARKVPEGPLVLKRLSIELEASVPSTNSRCN